MAELLTVRATPVFARTWAALEDPSVRVVVSQGGSRSSKTYSTVQCLVVLAHRDPNTVVSIVRKTGPALKATVLRDFVDVMSTLGIYDPSRFNKTEGLYRLDNGSVFEFFAVDDSVKARGRKRTVCFVNECNELTAEEFLQLRLRTSGKCVLDFNPSEDSGWWYDCASEPGGVLIRSTYLDNPFLGADQAAYIAGLASFDEGYHRIYALGERPARTDRVYTHFVRHSAVPEGVTRTCYGMDFGWNDPTVLVRADFVGEREVYLRQLYWRTERTAAETAQEVSALGLGDSPVYCDHRPEAVEELKRQGIDARNARKEILAGIDRLKSMRVSVHQDSADLWDEVRRYSYRTLRTGNLSDGVPLDRFNHGLDAARYAVHGTEPVEACFDVWSGGI